MRIKHLTFWSDVGFNESDRIVPALSNLTTLPSGGYNINMNLYPAPDKFFSELHIKEPAVRLMYMSYMKVEVEYTNDLLFPESGYPSVDQDIYGWIDSVEAMSDNNGFPMTVVRWHIDYWRTYAALATYTSGRVDRITNLGTLCKRYKQPLNEKYFKVDTTQTLIPITNTYWVYMTANYQAQGTTTVISATYCFPVLITDNEDDNYYIANQNYTSGSGSKCISGHEVISGLWGTFLSINKENIKNVMISPIPPVTMLGNGSENDPFRPSENARWRVTTESLATAYGFHWFYVDVDHQVYDYPYEEYDVSVASMGISPTETARYVITGFDGEAIQEIPFGMELRTMSYRTVIGPISGYIEIRFKFYDTSLSSSADARMNGICAVIPLISVEFSNSSLSEYIYSGQRQYDINAATIQRNKALVSGITGIGSSAISGAVTGSIAMPGIGTIAGMAGGAVSSAASAGIQYAASGYFDSLEQGNRDALMASQPDTMLMSGPGYDFTKYGQSISVKKLVPDADSLDHFNNIITNEGYIVGDYISTGLDTALRSLTGAVKISELKIGGNLPAVAKAYIKQRFANGVILS